MRKAMLVCVAVALAGCGAPAALKTEAQGNLDRIRVFVRLMETPGAGGAEQTTREQEREMLRLQADAWEAFVEALK